MLRDPSGQQVEELRYETHMWGGLAAVEEHAKKGGVAVVALLKELSGRVQLQRDYAAGLKGLGTELGEAQARLFEPTRKRGANQETEAEHLDRSAVQPLRKWHGEGSKELEQLVKKGGELKGTEWTEWCTRCDDWGHSQDRLSAHVKAVETGREQYHKAAEGAELAQREFEYAQKNMLLEAKERQRIESALKERAPAAAAAEKKYSSAVEEGNKAREQHVQFMRMLLAAHETLELARLRALGAAVAALWEVDAGVPAPAVEPRKTVQIWIAEHQTGLAPPPPFVFVPYEPHLPTIPYEAPDPGSLPTGPKVAEVTRRQVMPKMIPVKRFMRGVYAALAAQTNPDAGAPKSPRGGKFSPRKKGTSDEAAVVSTGEAPLHKHAMYAFATREASSGFEFVDLYDDEKAPLVRHVRPGSPDDLSALWKAAIRGEHIESNEMQLLKIVYGQAVESRGRDRAKGGHDVDTPMLFHVVYCAAREPAVEAWLAAKSTEWKGTDKKGKWVEREGGLERCEHASVACFSEAELTFRLYRTVYRSKEAVVVEFFLRPDCDILSVKWIAQYALRDELSEEARAQKLENQPSVLTIKSRGHIVVAGCRVRAISDFEPDKDGVPRLRLAKGEILEVLADDDGSGWLQCRNAKGAAGFAPSNFVTLVPK